MASVSITGTLWTSLSEHMKIIPPVVVLVAFEDERKSKMSIWSNTLNFDRQFGIHRIQSVLGYEESEFFPEEYNNTEYYGDFNNKAEYGHAEKVISSYASFTVFRYSTKSHFCQGGLWFA